MGIFNRSLRDGGGGAVGQDPMGVQNGNSDQEETLKDGVNEDGAARDGRPYRGDR